MSKGLSRTSSFFYQQSKEHNFAKFDLLLISLQTGLHNFCTTQHRKIDFFAIATAVACTVAVAVAVTVAFAVPPLQSPSTKAIQPDEVIAQLLWLSYVLQSGSALPFHDLP